MSNIAFLKTYHVPDVTQDYRLTRDVGEWMFIESGSGSGLGD